MVRLKDVEFRFSKSGANSEIAALRAALTPGEPKFDTYDPPFANLQHRFSWRSSGGRPLLGYEWRVPELSTTWKKPLTTDSSEPSTGFISLVPNVPLTVEARGMSVFDSSVGSRSFTWAVSKDWIHTSADLVDDSEENGEGSYIFSAKGVAYTSDPGSVLNGPIKYNLSVRMKDGTPFLLEEGEVEFVGGDVSLPYYDSQGLFTDQSGQTVTLVLNKYPTAKIDVVLPDLTSDN